MLKKEPEYGRKVGRSKVIRLVEVEKDLREMKTMTNKIRRRNYVTEGSSAPITRSLISFTIL
jgi:hypothetical protein